MYIDKSQNRKKSSDADVIWYGWSPGAFEAPTQRAGSLSKGVSPNPKPVADSPLFLLPSACKDHNLIFFRTLNHPVSPFVDILLTYQTILVSENSNSLCELLKSSFLDLR